MPRDEKPNSRPPRRPSGSGERTGRPARPFVPGSRPPRPAGAARPRRDDDRPARPRRDDARSERPARPRRDDSRSSARSTDRPARSFDRDRPARPRRDDDRPARSSARSSDRPARPARPRRDDARSDRPTRSSDRSSARPARSFDRDRPSSSSRPRRDDARSSARPARSFDRDRPSSSSRPRRDDARSDRPARSFDRSFDRPSRPRRDDDRRPRRDDDRPARPRRFDRDDAPDTRTAAQRKSDEVSNRTGGRRYGTDPYPPTTHTRERWQDEGSTRKSSDDSKHRSKRSSRRDDDDDRVLPVSIKNVDVGVANKIKERLGTSADRAIERLARSLHAFEAHRYSESRKLIMPLLTQLEGIALIHEVAGLSMYRLGRWQDAADQLEIARGAAAGEVTNHPVLADCYRALRRYEKVTELWEELKLMSPPPGLLAEGRIVAASALADQGELQAAVRMMTHGTSDPHKVQEHHLREWYVLGDLYDRAGDVAGARRLFTKIQSNEASFADVADRLSTLGE